MNYPLRSSNFRCRYVVSVVVSEGPEVQSVGIEGAVGEVPDDEDEAQGVVRRH